MTSPSESLALMAFKDGVIAAFYDTPAGADYPGRTAAGDAYASGESFGASLRRSVAEAHARRLVESFARTAAYAVTSLWAAHGGRDLTPAEDERFTRLLFDFYQEVSCPCQPPAASPTASSSSATPPGAPPGAPTPPPTS